MKKWMVVAGLLAVLLVAGYFAIFKATVPSVAKAFTPLKWENIPIGEKRILVHEYLGLPDSVMPEKDLWFSPINDMKRYVLDITYQEDSIARDYSITYEVDLFGLKHESEVASYDSLRAK